MVFVMLPNTVFLSLFLFCAIQTVHAQTGPPITSSGFNTNVTSNGGTYNITGGTRPGGGESLFHSFGEFSVPTNHIANFLNDSGLSTSNILGRVTGNNPSSIFGTIQTTGFGNANLFLINPSGIVFGPSASLNVGGSVTFTTADYLRLADGGRFSAIADVATDSLLSAKPIVAFGFLGTDPGAITVQGSRLTVTGGTGISLIGGNIAIQSTTLGDGTAQSAKISVPSGQINLVSVSSPGEITVADFSPSSNILGNISLSQGAILDVSANTAGTIKIRGGQLVIAEGTILADTIGADGASTAVDINIARGLTISNEFVPAITARTTGNGNAGVISIASGNMTVATESTVGAELAMIDSHAAGSGRAGKVSITTGDLNANGQVWFIDSGTEAAGNGNDLTITAKNIILNDMEINTGDFRAINQGIFTSSGAGGNIRIAADSLTVFANVLASQAFASRAGAVTLEVGELQLRSGSLLSTTALEGSGAVTITANKLTMDNGALIETETAFAAGGNISINAAAVEMKNGSAIRTQTSGPESAGNILVTATDHITLSDEMVTPRPSGLYSNSLGVEGEPLDTLGGNAGSIRVTTPRLELRGGARIDTTTHTSGGGGEVTISSTGPVSLAGERTVPIPEDFFSLGSDTAGGIFTRTIGGEFCSGLCGNAGHITITSGFLSINSGSIINSGTSSSGHGGNISIRASNAIEMSGILSTTEPGGIQSRSIGASPDAGSGGNISLTAGQSVSVSKGASVSASSTGPGNAGNISINAGRQFDVRNGSITTKAEQASGGNIDIRAIDRIRFANSTVSASVGADSGNGGNITIDPNVVVLQKSQILAQAVQGHGGNITITTPMFLQDQRSLVDASSQFGVSGTVTIQSPISNLSGTVKQLPSKPRETQALLQNRCAALAGGEQSTFILAGRDTLPSEPGGWLSSPLSMDHLMGHGMEHAAVPTARSIGLHQSPAMIARAGETQVLSLRRLTPPGFLVRTFAIDGPTGCHS